MHFGSGECIDVITYTQGQLLPGNTRFIHGRPADCEKIAPNIAIFIQPNLKSRCRSLSKCPLASGFGLTRISHQRVPLLAVRQAV
ncbi:MAG: hypothetical protein ACWGMZ_07065, partial [Thermoguttaceae bacterium]